MAFWGMTIPEWLDNESKRLVEELNGGVGQSQSVDFIRAEYGQGQMTFYYRSVHRNPAADFGAVVEDQHGRVLRQYCDSAYYRKRLDAGLTYKLIYQGDQAPKPLTITANRCANLYD